MSDESVLPRYRSAEFLLLIVVIIWASNFPIAKYGIRGLDIFVFNGIRYLSAFIAVALIFRLRGKWKDVHSSDWRKMIGVGFLAHVVYQLAFIVGLKLTTAGNSAILLATSPLWTVFLSARMHKEAIPFQTWMGMVLSLVGIATIIVASGREVEFGSSAILGDLITLLAALLWALNTNMQKPLLVHHSSMQLTVVMVAVGAVAHTLFSLPDALTMSWGDTHPTYFLAAVVSGALTIGVGNVLWSYGVKRIGPSRTANVSNLTPVLAFIISYLTLNEAVSLLHVVGGAVTIMGIWIARR
ncbi:MAG: DMT family transporter [Bacteroidota bacterium]